MVVENEEKEAMDIIAPSLLPRTGKDAAAALKLRTADVKPPQFRPPGHRRDDRRGSSKWLRKYQRRRRRFPIHLAPGPRTDLEAAFQALKQQTNAPTVRGQRNNEWISEATWTLVDRRAGIQQKGELVQALRRRIGRQIKSALKKDRTTRAEKVASKVEGHLSVGELEEAW